MLHKNHIQAGIIYTIALAALGGCSHKRIEERMNVENKQSAESIYRVGYSMFKAGDLATATRMFKQALSVNPQHIPSLVGLAQIARQTRQVKDTSILLEKALVTNPNNNELMAELAKLYIIDSDGVQAETLLRKLIVKDVKIDRLNALGVALDLQQKHLEAQKYYNQALKIDPHHVGVLSNIGLSLALEGRYQESLGYLEALLKRDHPSVRDRQNVALVYALSGNLEHARKIYKIDMDEKSVENNLATIEKLSARLLEKSYKIDTPIAQSALPTTQSLSTFETVTLQPEVNNEPINLRVKGPGTSPTIYDLINH